MTAQIGDAACTTDAQCRTIGLGSKPCGGFERYVAWSTVRSDADALRRSADEQVARERKARSTGDTPLSNCQLITDPGAYCAPGSAAAAPAAGTCRLRSERGGAGNQLR